MSDGNASTTNSTDESIDYDTGSVQSLCDQLSTFSDLAPSDLGLDADHNAVPPLTHAAGSGEMTAETIKVETEVLNESFPHSIALRFEPTRNVVVIIKKKGERQISNPFRRYGAIRLIHAYGGLVPPRGRDKKSREVRAGSEPPKMPRGAHFALHHDDLLDAAIFRFQFDQNAPSSVAAHYVALKIKEHCENWIRNEDSSSSSSTSSPSTKKQ
ncbi:hypothetical protein M3Y98_00484900 [Aphelenchoides besseyi]|nr:hypothetical protein M3Y98_00484900 [Aphelenchoides besseyi]